MELSLIYDGYASLSGTPDHLVPRLDPLDLCGGPVSGTEVALFGTAFELAKRGHGVKVYGRWVNHGKPGFDVDGVLFLDLESPHDRTNCDVALAYHDARPLARWGRYCLKAAHHQSFGLSPDEVKTNFADLYLTATPRVARHHLEAYGREMVVVPNAWDFGQHLEWAPAPGRMVFATSLDRGFHRLLEVLPEIQRQVPQAHVWAFERGSPDAVRAARIAADGSGGRIRLFSPRSRNEVLAAMATAACVAYPCDPPSPCEVWPMFVHDALATGVPVVLAPADGLEELFTYPVTWLQPHVRNPEWKSYFVDAVTRVLTNNAPDFGSYGKEWARTWTFERSVDRLLAALSQKLR